MRPKLFDGKKIDVIELVNTLGAINDNLEKLVSLEGKIDQLLSTPVVPDSISIPSPDMSAPMVLDPDSWMNESKKFIGIDEHDDEDKVIAMSQQAGTPINSSETPWCAIFVNAILASVGLKTTGTMRARDFENYGEPCEEKVGAIVVYRSHVGFVPEIGKVLGGNQSDGVNIGQQSWYGKVICYRWPTS